jgi:type VI secretion system FHA domain protein
MTCTLTIENVPSLASGDPISMALHEHGLSIGRANHADWTLPDARNFISSLHADIDYIDGQYVLTDRSTNGTFINGNSQRLTGPHALREGDLIRVGQYEIRVSLGAGASSGFGGGSSGMATAGGGLDWLSAAGGGASAPTREDRFGQAAARPLFQSGDDPLMAGFAPPQPVASPFGTAPVAAAPDPFGLAAAAAPHAPPAMPMPAADPFGIAGAPAAAPAAPAPGADPFGMAAPPAASPFGVAAPAPANPFGATPAATAPAADNPWAKLQAFEQIDFASAAAPPPAPSLVAPSPPAAANAAAAPAPLAGDDGYARFLAAAGLKPRDVDGVAPAEVLEAAGQLLRQATDGLIRLLDARTRVRHQFGVGAQVTRFQAQGNNPLKWTRQPEQALRQMVGQPDAGFLRGAQAVQGAFEDLQAHEVAMLAAMQDALAATVQRFSPDAIRQRTQGQAGLAGLLPGAREAALWRAFEIEFRTLAAESDAAYLDLFARQFRAAYERAVKKD